MGFFSKKVEERKIKKYLTNTFKLINGYSPVYSTFSGGLYEMALTRTCVDKIATQCSKLNPVINTNKKVYKDIQTFLQNKPNKLMTTQQFLYRLITILLVENNAYIVPVYSDKYGTKVAGYYPVRSEGSKIVLYEGTEYLVYKINEEKYCIEYDRVGHLRRMYYKKEYMGESNSALAPTMDLINTQEQGIKEGVKSGAMIRFLAKLTNVINDEDLVKEQKRIRENQLSVENNGGVMIFDNKYSDIQKVDSKPFIVDKDNMDIIKNNVYNYFHCSESIIQNTASEDQWNLFYEDVIEPIAIQISQVLTNMIVKEEDAKRGLKVVLESTKLQFISNATKLSVSQQLFDRGIFTVNQVMAIWNLPPVEDGDKRYIRKEYTEVQNLDKDVIDSGKDSGNSNEESTKETNGETNDNQD